MRKGREISSYSVSFISPLCSLLIFKLSRKWMKKALSTHATKHPWLMADLTQTRVDERYLANAGYRGRGRKCCKHWSTDSGIYGSRDCFIPTAPSLFVSVLCAKTTYNSQNNSTLFFSLTRLINTFTHSPSSVSVTVITHSDQKRLGGGKGLFVSSFQVTVHPWKDVSPGAQARTWCRNHGGKLLAGSLALS